MRDFIIAVHDGKFHADDVAAVAIVRLATYLHGEELTVKRTRDEEELQKADVVFDTGMKNDPEHDRFDHHCKDFTTCHDDGTLMASAGQAWEWIHRKYGNVFMYKFDLKTDKNYQAFYKRIEHEVICGLDAVDNGFAPKDPAPLQQTLPMMISAFDMMYGEDDQNFAFMEAAKWFKTWFELKLRRTAEVIKAESTILHKAKGCKTEILVINEMLPWFTTSLQYFDEFKRFQVCVYPDLSDRTCWRIQTMPNSVERPQEQRCPAPKELWGVRENSGKTLGGVPIKFIHKSGFTGGIIGSVKDAVKAAEEWVRISRLENA